MSTPTQLRPAPASLPRDVPGYAQAYSSGVTPRILPTPPPIVVTPTSKTRVHQGVWILAVSALTCLVAGFLGSDGGRLTAPGIVAIAVVLLVGTFLTDRAVCRFERAQLAELQQGYTTTTYARGSWWLGSAARGVVKSGRTSWDFRSTWVLTSSGEVVSPPTCSIEPPGLYPSPSALGMLELWTGREWTNYLVPD